MFCCLNLVLFLITLHHLWFMSYTNDACFHQDHKMSFIFFILLTDLHCSGAHCWWCCHSYCDWIIFQHDWTTECSVCYTGFCSAKHSFEKGISMLGNWNIVRSETIVLLITSNHDVYIVSGSPRMNLDHLITWGCSHIDLIIKIKMDVDGSSWEFLFIPPLKTHVLLLPAWFIHQAERYFELMNNESRTSHNNRFCWPFFCHCDFFSALKRPESITWGCCMCWQS